MREYFQHARSMQTSFYNFLLEFRNRWEIKNDPDVFNKRYDQFSKTGSAARPGERFQRDSKSASLSNPFNVARHCSTKTGLGVPGVTTLYCK